MLLIVGSVVVLACIIAGYLMEGGALGVLNQPAEFIIIGGAAIGSLMISTPLPRAQEALRAASARSSRTGPARRTTSSCSAMLYQLFKLTQQSGVMALEAHCRGPGEEPDLLEAIPKFLARHHARRLLQPTRCKVIIIGGIAPHDLEALMDEDLEVHHHEALKPAATLNKVGDALPGLGIVAAVLGVVITMGAIDGPPAEIGHKVGAALVGTFLGILLWYGFVGPLATQPRAAGRRRRPATSSASRPACWRCTRACRRRSRSSSRAASLPRRRAADVRRDRSSSARAPAGRRRAGRGGVA